LERLEDTHYEKDTHYETEFNTVNDRKSNTAGLLAKSLNC
jgi:hypothetical protein